jgi:micrococcal nuclease
MRALTLLAAAALAAGLSSPALAYRRNIDAHDGDTISVNSSGAFTGFRIRLANIDAPELAGKCAEESALAIRARDRLAALAKDGVTFLTDFNTDNFGRLLAVVLDRQGRDLGQILVSEGLAHPFNGSGPRQPWCPGAAKAAPEQ